MNKKKSINKRLKKQTGGDNVVNASIDLVKSMVELGKSICTEIDGLKNFGNEVNNVSLATKI
jgi:hypothetical protein